MTPSQKLRRAWRSLQLARAEFLVRTAIDEARPGAMDDARRNIELWEAADKIHEIREKYYGRGK